MKDYNKKEAAPKGIMGAGSQEIQALVDSVTEYILNKPPGRMLKSLISAYAAYPAAEFYEKRKISSKVKELRRYYKMAEEHRQEIRHQNLEKIITLAGQTVPYYKDLFKAIKFEPERLREDVRHLEAIPYLTKEIILEHGDRLLSSPLSEVRHHMCRTGGSTGKSTVIYYDQEAADYSAAITQYSRERIGKKRFNTELHFACRFPNQTNVKQPSREDWKCFAMNRSNIFFDRIDEIGLEEIWQKLILRRPFLVHEHSSTIYALACYIEQEYGKSKVFEIFESSGELLEVYMRQKISDVLGCKVINRYGLAEFGVIAYELDGEEGGLQILESEGWPESREVSGEHEFVFTSFRNRLMPLIRYATGDLAKISNKGNNLVLTNLVGRIHDVIKINGIDHPTHHIMDVLDHRVGEIQEFQIDTRFTPSILRIVPKTNADKLQISARINNIWPDSFSIQFVGHNELVRVGTRNKFRHVVS